MTDKVYISAIDISNIGGLKAFHADLSQISIVEGSNGAGKSSVLGALDIVLSGGSDPDLIHLGADEGQILLTLSDGVTIRKALRKDGSTLVIRSADGGIVKRPAEYLKTLASGLNFNPVAFLDAEPKERAAFLLQNLPLTFEAQEVNAVIDASIFSAPVTLSKLNEVREGKYADRTDLNRRVKEGESAIADMKKALPPDGPDDWNAVAEIIQDKLTAISSEIATAASQIHIEAEQALALRREDIGMRMVALNAELAKYAEEVNKAASDSLAEETSKLEAQRSELSMQLGDAKAKAQQQQQSVGIKKAIETRKAALSTSISDEIRLSNQIKALDELKHKKLRELDIQGLDLKMVGTKPVITIDGIPLDKLNRQSQLYIAIQAVQLAAGRLPLIIAESAELDSDHLKELTGVAKEAGLQLVLARWKNAAPLQVVSA